MDWWWALDGSCTEDMIETETEAVCSPGLVRYMWSLGEAISKDPLKALSEGS